jgi:hypothetical protein
MKVRFKTLEDALSAKEKAEKHLESVRKILKTDEQNGWGKDASHYLFLSILRKERSLLTKINAWLENQQSRLTKSKKGQFARKSKWNPTSLKNHIEIRRARRDKREYREALFADWSHDYDLYRNLDNFDPIMHALECSECDLENDGWMEYRLERYNRQNFYSELLERDLYLQSLRANDGSHVEEDRCYECGGVCTQYEEYMYSLYDVNNDMREQEYHEELIKKKIIGQLALRYRKSNPFDFYDDTYESDARIDSSYFIG